MISQVIILMSVPSLRVEKKSWRREVGAKTQKKEKW